MISKSSLKVVYGVMVYGVLREKASSPQCLCSHGMPLTVMACVGCGVFWYMENMEPDCHNGAKKLYNICKGRNGINKLTSKISAHDSSFKEEHDGSI